MKYKTNYFYSFILFALLQIYFNNCFFPVYKLIGIEAQENNLVLESINNYELNNIDSFSSSLVQPELFNASLSSSVIYKNRVILNMIVKNEAHVIIRCLESVKPIITNWVIVDTGSVDGTQQLIRDYMIDIPGMIYEREWKNFGHNRQEALELAKQELSLFKNNDENLENDYILFMDADERLEYDKTNIDNQNNTDISNSTSISSEASPFSNSSITLPFPLIQDWYYITTKNDGLEFQRTQLIKAKLDWRWVGVLHEVILSDQAKTFSIVNNTINRRGVVFGSRSNDTLKYQKDAALLLEVVEQQPDTKNARDVFYLAQSYRDAGNLTEAIRWYQTRINLHGWKEEVFVSLLEMGRLKLLMSEQQQGEDKEKREEEEEECKNDVIINTFLKAVKFYPQRAVEPLYEIAHFYWLQNDHQSAYYFGKMAQNLPFPVSSILFVNKWIYDWGILFDLSITAYYVGRYEESFKLNSLLLNISNLPKHIYKAVASNIEFSINKLN